MGTNKEIEHEHKNVEDGKELGKDSSSLRFLNEIYTAQQQPRTEKNLATGDHLSTKGSEQTLTTQDGDSFTMNTNPNSGQKWSLKDKDGNEVKEKPQLTRELRIPQWYELSNGGTVTYYDNKTELEFNGHKIAFDKNGVQSVTNGDITQTLHAAGPHRPDSIYEMIQPRPVAPPLDSNRLREQIMRMLKEHEAKTE